MLWRCCAVATSTSPEMRSWRCGDRPGNDDRVAPYGVEETVGFLRRLARRHPVLPEPPRTSRRRRRGARCAPSTSGSREILVGRGPLARRHVLRVFPGDDHVVDLLGEPAFVHRAVRECPQRWGSDTEPEPQSVVERRQIDRVGRTVTSAPRNPAFCSSVTPRGGGSSAARSCTRPRSISYASSKAPASSAKQVDVARRCRPPPRPPASPASSTSFVVRASGLRPWTSAWTSSRVGLSVDEPPPPAGRRAAAASNTAMYAPDFSRPARTMGNPISVERTCHAPVREGCETGSVSSTPSSESSSWRSAISCWSRSDILLWKTFVADGTLTLDNFRRAYSAVGLGEIKVNSLWFTAGTTAVAITLGTALAYLVVRTDLPWKPLVVALTMTQLIVPGVLYTIAWSSWRARAQGR